jgi:hypothetical protein
MDEQQRNLQIDESMQDESENDNESDAGTPGSRVNPQ